MRLAYLDNLRIGATGVILAYHAARGVDYPPFDVKPERVYALFEALTRLMDIWMMPLFFFVAGASSVYALRSRDDSAYLRERALRLLLPFGVAALTYLPIIGYFAYLGAHRGEAIRFSNSIRNISVFGSTIWTDLKGRSAQPICGFCFFFLLLRPCCRQCSEAGCAEGAPRSAGGGDKRAAPDPHSRGAAGAGAADGRARLL